VKLGRVFSDEMDDMNKPIRTYAAPLLLCTGVAFSQPTWDEGESFDDFREEWNGWVAAITEDQKFAHESQKLLDELIGVLTQPNSDFDGWTVMQIAAPGNEYWEYADEVFIDHRTYFDRAYELATRSYTGVEFPDRSAYESADVTPAEEVEAYSEQVSTAINHLHLFLVSHLKYLAYSGDTDGAIDRLRVVSQLYNPEDRIYSDHLHATNLGHWAVCGAIEEMLASEHIQFTQSQLAYLQLLVASLEYSPLDTMVQFQNRVAYETWRLEYSEGQYDLDFTINVIEQADVFHDWFESDPPLVPRPDPIPDIPLAEPADQLQMVQKITKAFMRDLSERTYRKGHLHFDDAMSACLEAPGEIDRYAIAYGHTRIWRLQLITHLKYQAENQYLQVAIALHRHRARHGEWPLRLVELDPDVQSVPAVDFFSRQPLGYERNDEEPFLWAFGPDRDDDGGVWIKPSNEFVAENFEIRLWMTDSQFESLTEYQREQLDGDVFIMPAKSADID
jgi:hypothetical protein